MKKVLWFVDRFLVGGIQSFLKNIADNIEKKELQIDFLVLDDGVHYELEDYFTDKGYKVYKLNGIWIRKAVDYFPYCKAINNFFKEHNDYDVVHMHSSSKNFPVLYYAKKYGVKKRIAHSHNIDFQTNSPLKKIVGNIFKVPLVHYANYYFACSELAGKWLFGEKIVKGNSFTVIKNGINTENFRFSETKRKAVRNKLGIENNLVIGNVGRFAEQKNHTFLVDIFYEMCKRKDDLVLLLVGTGALEDKIKKKLADLNLTDKVIFVGYQDDVSPYMQAMDIFLFPSLFEGLGIVLIEAQATGLPCYTSEKVVPYEVKITDNLKFISLNKDAKIWAELILKNSFERYDCLKKIKKMGYDIKTSAEQLYSLYTN